MSFLNHSVGQIATEIPGATAVFFQHKINFCCDGSRPLAEVIKRKSLDQKTILTAINHLNDRREGQRNYNDLSNQQIIEHLLQRYHQVHREQLVELIRLAERVETVHRDHPLCPTGLASLLAGMKRELEQHMHKEESILFPMLASGNNPMAGGPIHVMRTEHDDHLTQIQTIYRLTDDVTPHPDACNTWRALYLGLQEFISDLNQHIHIENDILFNRANA